MPLRSVLPAFCRPPECRNHFLFGSGGIRDASINPESPLVAQALPWAIGIRKLPIPNVMCGHQEGHLYRLFAPRRWAQVAAARHAVKYFGLFAPRRWAQVAAARHAVKYFGLFAPRRWAQVAAAADNSNRIRVVFQALPGHPIPPAVERHRFASSAPHDRPVPRRYPDRRIRDSYPERW